LLIEEVIFWRELIAAQDATRQSTETFERMNQALALAEFRLRGGSQICRH
jgi:hypothetical protein